MFMERVRKASTRLPQLLGVLIAVCLVLSVAARAVASFYQDFIDTFYMVASGEWMLTHQAIQYVGISSPVPTHFVSHNWLFCLFAALCLRISQTLGLDWWGMSLISIGMALACIAYASFVAYAMTNKSRIAIALTIIAFLLMPNLFVFRVRALTTALTVYCLWASWRYANGAKLQPLLFVPLITILHVNVQAPTALTHALVCFGYAVALLLWPRATTGDSRHRAAILAVVGVICIAATFVSPYGADAALYAFKNAGVAGYRNTVHEMQGISAWIANGESPLQELFLLPLIIAISIRSQVYARQQFVLETFMAFVGILSTLLAIRNSAYAFLLVWWLVMTTWDCMRDYLAYVAARFRRIRTPLLYLAYAAALIFTFYELDRIGTNWNSLQTDLLQSPTGLMSISSAPEEAADFIENDYGGRGACVLTDPNFGSYLEYRGFIVNCTSRWETWEPGITGVDEHFFFDTTDAFRFEGDEDALDRLLAITDWDYVIIEKRQTDKGRNAFRLISNRLRDTFELVYTQHDASTKSDDDENEDTFTICIWRRK